eukprot:5863770-Prymnesium_polylepis.1
MNHVWHLCVACAADLAVCAHLLFDDKTLRTDSTRSPRNAHPFACRCRQSVRAHGPFLWRRAAGQGGWDL